jgi:hypothetical protein
MNQCHSNSKIALLAVGLFGSVIAIAQTTTATDIKTADGQKVTVHSGQPEIPPDGPHPDFARLDVNNDGFLDTTEASAYPPLANDFKHADLNHDGKISKAEYAQWH